MKKLLCAVLALAMMMTACLAMAETVEEVIAQAQTMTNEELYAKAIEESNGKTLYGIGNSSRGKTAGASFIEMLQKIDPSYTGTIEWSQPKNNSIFTTLIVTCLHKLIGQINFIQHKSVIPANDFSIRIHTCGKRHFQPHRISLSAVHHQPHLRTHWHHRGPIIKRQPLLLHRSLS